MRLILAIILLLATTPTRAHEPYSNLVNKQGQGCCGGHDCFETETRTTNGVDEIFVKLAGNKWLPIPYDKVISVPFGGTHVCYWGGEIKCVMLGGAS